MNFVISANKFPRYQAIAMLSITMGLMTGMAGYFLVKQFNDNQTQLFELHSNVLLQHRQRIQVELDAAVDYIRYMQSQTEPTLKEKSKEVVDQVYKSVESTYLLTIDKYPVNEVKQLISESLRNVRFFNGRGYFFITQMDGVTVLQPDAPEYEGKNSLYDTDDTGRLIELGLIKATQNPDKAGFYHYRWFMPNEPSHQMQDKITYVRQFTPYNWVIGAGDYLIKIEKDLKAAALERLKSIKFDKHGYIAVLSEDGKMLLGPTEYADSYRTEHKRAVNTILTAANGNGIAHYEWFYPDGRGPVKKESLVVKVPGWNWILVSGYYPDDIEALLSVEQKKLSHRFEEDTQALVVMLGCTFSLTLLFSLLGAKGLKILFRYYQSNIEDQQATLEQTVKEMQYLAEYDPLTGLSNRRLLQKQVESSIFVASQEPKKSLALLFIDLDRFKYINDLLGHGVGDQVLQQVAKRLGHVVRSTDTVSRLGGDEFVILMTQQVSPEAVIALANGIINIIAEPMLIQENEQVLTPSIGIAVYPEDGKDFTTLLRNADIALYHAKDQGKNNYQFYTKQLSQQISEQLGIERALREAIEIGEFSLYYQPQYQLCDGTLSGYEALIRWDQPNKGFQAPDKFIPVAESTGLIKPIGDWVLRTACHQGASWLAKGFPEVRMAVNLSPHQFKEGLVAYIQQIVAESGFPATLLTLEITESTLMDQAEHAIEILGQLKSMGINIAVDDFGTGYSSLAYLKRLPLDELKIDKSFLDGLPDDNDDRALTSSIIDIGKNLGLRTVAEGVETREQRNVLIYLGCDQAQGYFYAKPMPPPEIEKLFIENRQFDEKQVAF